MGESPLNEEGLAISQLQRRVQEFNLERGWDRLHSVRALSEALVVESAELLELSLWNAQPEDHCAALRDEVADIGIYLLSLANQLSVDLGEVILDKLKANAKRFPSPHV